MHATADTRVVMLRQRCGAARDCGVRHAPNRKERESGRALRMSGSRGLNVYLNRRSNKRLNATAHSAAFINLVRGGALSAALARFV
jgi:hypothetical protein